MTDRALVEELIEKYFHKVGHIGVQTFRHALDEYAARAESAEQPAPTNAACRVEMDSSRMCELGTASCVVKHAASQSERLATPEGSVMASRKTVEAAPHADARDDELMLHRLRGWVARLSEEKQWGAVDLINQVSARIAALVAERDEAKNVALGFLRKDLDSSAVAREGIERLKNSLRRIVDKPKDAQAIATKALAFDPLNEPDEQLDAQSQLWGHLDDFIGLLENARHYVQAAADSIGDTPSIDLLDAIDDALKNAQLKQRAQEPTEEMIQAGMEASVLGRPSVDDSAYAVSIYKAMLAAAPKSDTAGGGE